MAALRMDHVSVVVDDLEAAIAFFVELGLEVEGEAALEGSWVDRVCGLEGVQCDIVMMRTPVGSGRLELTRYRVPAPTSPTPDASIANVTGLRSVMFAVDDVDATVGRLSNCGGILVGEVVQYEDLYRLCYMRGPAGVIVALAEELR